MWLPMFSIEFWRDKGSFCSIGTNVDRRGSETGSIDGGDGETNVDRRGSEAGSIDGGDGEERVVLASFFLTRFFGRTYEMNIVIEYISNSNCSKDMQTSFLFLHLCRSPFHCRTRTPFLIQTQISAPKC